MAPKSQNCRADLEPKEEESNPNGESVVISGISGIFPMSGSIKEFSMILYNEVNPVNSDNRQWTLEHPEVSEYSGKVPEIHRFDSQFFMVHHHQGNSMDPMARKVLEHSYEAIYDAGLSPKQLSGKKVGVYIGAAFSDMENTINFDTKSKFGYAISGCSKTMYANRISYWLNTKGPSLTVDDACCSSMLALEEAYSAIKRGICEAAIVGGCNLCIAPHGHVHYNRCIKISPDGKTRSFDENADGCARSEAIGIIFLQKAKNALRAYAELSHVKNEFTSKLSGETGQVFGFIRNPDISAAFMNKFYAEAGISPQTVEYIEACGSATPDADKAELQAIETVFCGNRSDPLLVGSVISNVGFTDAASGITALTKVLLGYHHGLIAGNLHCLNPRQDIAAIRDGCMRIATKHEPFRSTYAAVNCLSVTGVNSHALLRGITKTKDLSRYATSIPRLLTISSRQKNYLRDMFEDLKTRPIDAEEIALLHNIHSTNISGHLGRGYIILGTDEEQKTVCLSENMENSEDTNRPLWFVYSGMGSQWVGMGAQLMRIPIFAAAIERCQKVLEHKGIDVVHIITSQDKTIFNNVLNSFVGIAAIQIGLTDILVDLGLHPDKIIGHSVGELGCAYADGCLTAEEMILTAYSRGNASNDTSLIRGAMAAVGLGYHQLIKLCPPAIDIACHNSSSSSTISGPEEDVRIFVDKLTSNGVFAKEVPSANIAYHSRYIADAGPHLLRHLLDIIQKPKPRTERWLSTSVPQENWDEPIAKYCSAEYLTNNLLSPVLFEETSRLIPSNAVLIEIAPHGLLQAVLKRSLPESCKNIPLTQRGHKDNALFLLEAIGKIYVEGYTPQVQVLYPKVEFPVSTGTPHLAHHVKWNHTESWVIYGAVGRKTNLTKGDSVCKFLINTYNDEHRYLKGNVVQGHIIYPFAGALVAAWDTLAMTLGFMKKKVSVRFNNVQLYSQPILHDQKLLRLQVSVNRGNGWFEVLDEDSKVATGYIVPIETSKPNKNKISEKYHFSSDELYQHLSSRGYSYGEDFRSLYKADESLNNAQVLWNNNWVTMLDGLLQLNDLRQTYEEVLQPSQFRELVIDVEKHKRSIQEYAMDGKTSMNAEVDEIIDYTRCGGVLLRNLKFRKMPSSTPRIFKLITSGDPYKNKIKHTQVPGRNVTAGNIALQIHTIGDLDELYWAEAPRTSDCGIRVLVKYAGINISDVKKATGVIPYGDDEKYFGMDFSGLTESGDPVMGLVRNGAASIMVTALPELLWPVPAYWSLEEAATVPLAYVQAFYYLCVKNELQKGWMVLVHGAAGALGQAAIAVALAHGCKVFATVADNAKKRFLLKLFPQLNEDAIGYSRDSSFGDMVLNATNGNGCNIVISCVREDLKNISLKCAGFSGVTIDMVQIQNRDRYEYGMYNMTKQRAYIAADFYSILDSGNHKILKKLQTLLSDGIARGYVRPLSHVTYAPHEASRAFRLLVASRHRGRVLLQMQETTTNALPRIVGTPMNSYLMFWDGNSLGLQLAERLIARGATKLSFYCLQSTKNHIFKLRFWKKAGIDIEIFNDALTNSGDVLDVIKETTKRGPIEGIYVTTEAFLGGDDKKTKFIATIIEQLDIASRELCPVLKYFAVINVNNYVGQQPCLSRSRDGFPATLLSLPSLMKVNMNKESFVDECTWNKSAVDVIEETLRSFFPELIVQLIPAEKPPVLKLIAAFCEHEDEEVTLAELGLGESLQLVKSYLRDVHHVSLEDEEILMLTKKSLLALEMNAPKCYSEKINGLRVFFSYVDIDELQATTDLVAMKTLISGAEMIQGDENKNHLFVIPGLEGHHERFHSLCERLKLPAFVLQPGLDWPEETPRELAIRYSKVLLDKMKVRNNFYLLGYEFGVLTAIELASILEDHGLTGTVYCLGDGPEEMKSLLESELSAFETEDALQMGVTRHMSTLMVRGTSSPAANTLNEYSSWRNRIDTCIRSLLGRMSHSVQYARALLEAAYARIGTARRYNTAPRTLRSRLVLLRVHRDIPSDGECSLQRFSNSPLIVKNLKTPMALAAADLQVPAIINRYLGGDLLEAYERSNLCETYVY